VDRPVVGVVVGSDSDLPVVYQACETLGRLAVPYEVVIASAHRTPEKTAEYARTAEERGLAVIIAAAGGAAHLPGVIAAYTRLPVIGLPVQNGALQGVDALYSIVQMPPGVPVAAVAINGAVNAALFAARIVGAGDPGVRERLRRYQEEMAARVEEKAARLAALGIEKYLENKG